MLSRFPVAFRPPAFASRVILFPLRSSAFLTVGLPTTTTHRPDPDGVTTFHTREMRPGWVPSRPRDGGAHPAGSLSPPAGACRFPAASPTRPTATTHQRGSTMTRHHQGSLTFTRPVFPSPVAPGWNEDPWA